MKQHTLLTILIVALFSSLSFAQDTKKLAKTAANGLCDCVNETYSNIDSDVKNAMVTIIKYQMNGQQQEMEQYANSLSADLATRIEAQANEFTANQDMFDLCVEDIQLTLAENTLDDNIDVTEEEFMQMLMNEMSQGRNCKFAYLLMQLGLAEQDNNNNSNNGTINNDNNNKYEKPKPKPPVNNNNSNGGDEQGTGGN